MCISFSLWDFWDEMRAWLAPRQGAGTPIRRDRW